MKSTYKKHTHTPALLLSAAMLTAALSGCGSDSSSTNSGAEMTGVFSNTIVEGIDYACSDGTSSTTNVDGEFTCSEDDMVSFSLAGNTLGAAGMTAEIDLFDLVGAAQPLQRQLNTYLHGSLNKVSERPITHALNTAVFLQTLDKDDDPSNGISITPATSDAIAATTYRLDFGESNFDFHNKLTKVLLQAGLGKKPVSALSTIRHLVDTGEITTPLFKRTRDEKDSNLDGFADAINSYNYDADGNLILEERDSDADGITDRTITTSYDPYGNEILIEEDYDANGVADSITSYNRDNFGNSVLYEFDGNGDSILESSYSTTYDAHGNDLIENTDSNGDGTLDRIIYLTYDQYGNRIIWEMDSGADGVTNYLSNTTYDADGNKLIMETDWDANGIVDAITTYIYDANGHQVRREYNNLVTPANNKNRIYTYDANGNRTSEMTDDGAEGNFESIDTYAYEVDGNLIRAEYDWNGDSNVDAVDTHNYDTKGNLISSVIGDGGYAITYSYDSYGNLTGFEFDSDGNGTPDLAHTLVYEQTSVFPGAKDGSVSKEVGAID